MEAGVSQRCVQLAGDLLGVAGQRAGLRLPGPRAVVRDDSGKPADGTSHSVPTEAATGPARFQDHYRPGLADDQHVYAMASHVDVQVSLRGCLAGALATARRG
jgi:hypothetical protein